MFPLFPETARGWKTVLLVLLPWRKKKPWTSLFRLFMLSISQKHGTSYMNLPDPKHRAHTQYSKARISITLCWCSGSAPSLKNNTICNIYMLLLSSDPKWSWKIEVKCKHWVIWKSLHLVQKWVKILQFGPSLKILQTESQWYLFLCLASYIPISLCPKTTPLSTRNKDWCHWWPLSQKLTQPGVNLHLHNFTDSSRIYSSQSLGWE